MEEREIVVVGLRAKEVVKRVKVGGKGARVRAVGMMEEGVKVSNFEAAKIAKETRMVIVGNGGWAPAVIAVVEMSATVEFWVIDIT